MRRALAHRGVQQVVAALFCNSGCRNCQPRAAGRSGPVDALTSSRASMASRGRPRQPAQPARADRPVAEVAFVLGPLIIGFAAEVIAGRRDGGRGYDLAAGRLVAARRACVRSGRVETPRHRVRPCPHQLTGHVNPHVSLGRGTHFPACERSAAGPRHEEVVQPGRPHHLCRECCDQVARARKWRSRRLLPTTKTELNAMAAPAIIGLSRPTAASGMAATL